MSYLAPTDLDAAFRFLADQPGARVVAGCTDYFPSRTAAQVGESLLDITRITGLRGITQSDQGWHIGAATTWTDVIQAPLPAAFDALKRAAREVGSVQIQNRGTLAGNICNASPAADGVPPLLALDALVDITGPTGARSLPLAAFITGVRQTALRPGELVTALRIPPQARGATSGFVKLGSRTHLVISIAMVAAVIETKAGQITAARLAVGSCAPVAQRLPALEAALIGQTARSLADWTLPQAALAPLSPITDVRGSAAYRLDAGAELCRRAILQALGDA